MYDVYSRKNLGMRKYEKYCKRFSGNQQKLAENKRSLEKYYRYILVYSYMHMYLCLQARSLSPIAYSSQGGGVPYSEHRLFELQTLSLCLSFYVFPSVMVLVPSFPPPPRFTRVLALQGIFPVSSLLSSFLPLLCPYSCIQPTPSSSVWSFIVRPS